MELWGSTYVPLQTQRFQHVLLAGASLAVVFLLAEPHISAFKESFSIWDAAFSFFITHVCVSSRILVVTGFVHTDSSIYSVLEI